MFPGEMLILMAIAKTGNSTNKMIIRSSNGTGEYVGLLCGSLVTRGYLKGSTVKGFNLTPKGKESIIIFLRQNKSRVNDTINVLKRLGIEKSQEIDELAREAVRVE